MHTHTCEHYILIDWFDCPIWKHVYMCLCELVLPVLMRMKIAQKQNSSIVSSYALPSQETEGSFNLRYLLYDFTPKDSFKLWKTYYLLWVFSFRVPGDFQSKPKLDFVRKNQAASFNQSLIQYFFLQLISVFFFLFSFILCPILTLTLTLNLW